jgi:glycosyltransferase involved in cell wall biosynthesis
MRLLIISPTPHHRRGDEIVGWGATLREIDELAALFDEVVHVAPLHDGPAPDSALPYRSGRVRFVPVPPSGGDDLRAKLGILGRAPTYLRVIRRELLEADAVHVRCPANISLFALMLLSAMRHPARRWVKYAGAWGDVVQESPFSRVQRLWLQRGVPGVEVTVNGTWPGQPPHVHSFVNPCLTQAELDEGREAASRKRPGPPWRILFVGRVDPAKGVGELIGACALLAREGRPVELEIVGEGDPAIRADLEQRARAAGLSARFLGGLPRDALGAHYAAAHIVALPSRAEGWPKVLSEGMAYGAVPVATRVGSIGSMLDELGLGAAVPVGDVGALAAALRAYLDDPSRWQRESRLASREGPRFGYGDYVERVRRLLHLGAA